jgi:hypothetical protein
MDRRSFLTGAASLATLAGVRDAQALTPAEKQLLLGGVIPPPVGYSYFLVQTSPGVFEQFTVQTSSGVFENFAVKVS